MENWNHQFGGYDKLSIYCKVLYFKNDLGLNLIKAYFYFSVLLFELDFSITFELFTAMKSHCWSLLKINCMDEGTGEVDALTCTTNTKRMMHYGETGEFETL